MLGNRLEKKWGPGLFFLKKLCPYIEFLWKGKISGSR
jgi:hypothetical protein